LPQETFLANLDAVAAVIKRERPDVLAVQEADAPSTWSGSFDHVQRLAAATGYPHIHHGIHFDTDKRGLKLEYGTALLAHCVFDTPASFRFAARPLDTKGFVTAEIEFDGRPLLVASAHLDARSASIRSRQVEKMISCLSSSGKPIVLMGDLNSRWSHEDDAVRLLASRLGLHAYRPDQPGLATFRANGPNKRIDWILISPELEFVDYRVWPDQLSDHLAVTADLRWRD
jgi:endonuclease/exonuclease/phosphatase family metal-dependent hydrolase